MTQKTNLFSVAAGLKIETSRKNILLKVNHAVRVLSHNTEHTDLSDRGHIVTSH